MALVAMFAALALSVSAAPASAGAATAEAKAPAGKCPLKARSAHAAAARRVCRKRARARARRQRQAQRRRAQAPVPSVPVAAPAPIQEPPTGRQVSHLARCEIILMGPCDIYTDKFWEMQAKFAHLEYETGTYPGHPECSGPCPAAVAHLYPDGTIGYALWVPDACAPGGWRMMSLEPPCPF
jgi:hypothetical protein